MKTCAGNASIEKFINFAKSVKKDDHIDIIYNIVELGDKLLKMQSDFDKSSDTKELYERIILFDATIPKKGRNCHILVKNMNIETFMKFFKKHLITKIDLLKKDPTKLVQSVGNTFTDFVDQLLNILEKINHVLPSIEYKDICQTNDINDNTDNGIVYYKLMYDNVNECFYEIIDNGIFIVKPEKLYEFAEKQKLFFEKFGNNN